MSNDCFYQMKAVSKTKDALEKLKKILNYKDEDYYIYRVKDAEAFDEIAKEGDFYVLNIDGVVAWSCGYWFNESRKTENDHELPNFPNATYTTLINICKKLGIAIEVFGKENGNCFQEHYQCDHNGNVFEDSEDWFEEWEDEDGNELDEPIESGGLKDYGVYLPAAELYA